MKKIFVFTAVMCCILSLFAKGKKDFNGTYTEVEGVIQLYGNMPFAYEGLVTDDGKYFSLKADSEKMKTKIAELTGKRVKVCGYVDLPAGEDELSIKAFDMLNDGYLWVQEIDKIKPPKKARK